MVQHSTLDHSGITGIISSYGSNANSVAAISAGGASTSASRADHVHVGVTSLTHTSNTISGPITLVAQGSIGITKTNATTFAINAVAGSGGGGSDGNDESGKQLGYKEATGTVTVTSATEGTETDIITSDSITFDGTPVWVEFGCPRVRVIPSAAGRGGILTIWIDSTSQGRLALYNPIFVSGQGAIDGKTYRRQLTPSAGSHTISIKGWKSTAGETFDLTPGAGTAGVEVPMYLRITKA